MVTASQRDEEFVVAAFLRQYRTDQVRGCVPPLEHYVRRFAGHEARIATEFSLLQTETRQADATAPPDTIGRYQILEELGRGGQGTVFLAADPLLQRRVALKVLSGLGPWSEKATERLRREAEAASRLEDPAICTVYDMGWAAGMPFLAMRYIAGDTLALRISRAKKTGDSVVGAGTPVAIARFFETAARALHKAHVAGVVHRDIKPGNVMVDRESPVILDFGLAFEASDASTVWSSSAGPFGTPAYMSTEQLSQPHDDLDARTDIYSLGVSLYEALTLQRPFEGPTREATYHAITTRSATPCNRVNPAIPRSLATVVAKALRKERDDRYATAEEFAADLRAVVEGRPIAANPESVSSRVVRWVRREPALAVMTAVAAIGLLVAAAATGFVFANLDNLEAERQRQAWLETERMLAIAYGNFYGGDLLRATEMFQEVLAREPDSIEALGGLVGSLARSDRKLAALRLIADRSDLHERHPALLRLRARIEGESPPSEPRLRRSEDLFVAVAVGSYFDAITDARRQRLRDAIEQAILQDPHQPRFLYYDVLAVVARLSGDRALGTRAAKALAALWPRFSYAWSARSYALWFDRDAAIASCQKAIELLPSNDFAHASLGEIHAQSHAAADNQRAIDSFARALEIRPQSRRYKRLLSEARKRAARLVGK